MKSSSNTAYDNYWDKGFLLLSYPVSLWQVLQPGELRLIQANQSFRSLFQLSARVKTQATKRLPSGFIQSLQSMLVEPEKQSLLWCSAEAADQSRCFQLELTKLTDKNDCFLLSMPELTPLYQQVNELKQQNNELQQRLTSVERLKNRISEQAIRDPLTNLFNRRFLNEFMERELALARRNQTPLAVVMLDLDHFKQLNDQFGHQTGDRVIEMVAKHLLRQSRRTDVLFRYGGEEFLVILPNTSATQARHLADTWRSQVEQSAIYAKNQALSITLSAGIACYPEHGTTTFNLIQAADQALYQAKAAGRNQVVMC